MKFEFIEILMVIPAAIIGLTVHEFSHALMAYKLGDNTAQLDGRLTLNPIKHIDWLGFILILVAGFGWAKPVRFNPELLKNKKRDEILIAVAGPLSNLILGIIFLSFAKVIYGMSAGQETFWISTSTEVLIVWSVINFGLFIFNLIPLPPLDGSHFYIGYLKEKNPTLTQNIYQYGSVVLLGIIIIESYLNVDILHLNKMVHSLTSFFLTVFNFPIG